MLDTTRQMRNMVCNMSVFLLVKIYYQGTMVSTSTINLQTGMISDEPSPLSERLTRVRQSVAERDRPIVSAWVPFLDADKSPPIQERLSVPNVDGSLTRDRLSGRVPRPALPEVSPPTLEPRLPSVSVRNRLPTPAVRERLSTSDVRGRLNATAVRPPSVSLDSAEAYILEREGIDPETHESRTTSPEYFVGVIPESHETVSETLSSSDFGQSYITRPKFLVEEEFGIRREASSIWVYRDWSFSHFQLHVPLFELPDESGVYVFYHHEYNWLRHPTIHREGEYLNPEWDRDRVVELFDEAGLEIRTCGELDSRFEVATTYCQESGCA